MPPWVRDPELLPGEQVVWRRSVNREQGWLRQVGGKLFVTDQRLLFMPNRFDDATGGEEWGCPLGDITAVGVEPRRPAMPFLGRSAALRRRLRVDLRSGDREIFVVNRVTEAAEVLRAATAAGAA